MYKHLADGIKDALNTKFYDGVTLADVNVVNSTNIVITVVAITLSDSDDDPEKAVIQGYITDKNGIRHNFKITGTDAATITPEDLPEDFDKSIIDITATISTEKGYKGDLSAYNVPVSAAEIDLKYYNDQGREPSGLKEGTYVPPETP